VSAAVIMDIHSHLCKTEVIGMLGGLYDEQKTVLRIVRAEPCNSWSSTMHCDMDPGKYTVMVCMRLKQNWDDSFVLGHLKPKVCYKPAGAGSFE